MVLFCGNRIAKALSRYPDCSDGWSHYEIRGRRHHKGAQVSPEFRAQKRITTSFFCVFCYVKINIRYLPDFKSVKLAAFSQAIGGNTHEAF